MAGETALQEKKEEHKREGGAEATRGLPSMPEARIVQGDTSPGGVQEKKKRRKAIHTRGKRKEAIARATLKDGSGKIYLNGLELHAYDSPFVKEVITEPLNFVPQKNFDIHINVRGGGFSGQAQAARTAVARAIVKFTRDDKLKVQFMNYDRSLLVEDPRRVEPKKFKGPKARARFTKSYR